MLPNDKAFDAALPEGSCYLRLRLLPLESPELEERVALGILMRSSSSFC